VDGSSLFGGLHRHEIFIIVLELLQNDVHGVIAIVLHYLGDGVFAKFDTELLELGGDQ
jgi:hypothetical protein